MVAQNLIDRKASGSIVIMSSQLSKAATPPYSIYTTTKGAVDAFMRATALELGPHKIRINSINPTVVLTEMARIGGWHDSSKAAVLTNRIPLGRFAEVQEVVDATLFLLSDKSGMITGTCLPIEGGYLAG